MNLIKHIEVQGFWETHKISVDLNQDVTFFIGVNGTGKTTLINMIAAALTADFPTLEKLSFKRLTISLQSTDGRATPTITIIKNRKKDSPIELIEYRILPNKGAQEIRYSLDEGDEVIWLRRAEMRRRYIHDYYRQYERGGLLANLRDLVRVVWLSVHRTPTTDRPRDERTYESAVDRRLEAISNELVRYFASVSKQKDEEIRKFQEFIFVSLLEQPSDKDVFTFVDKASLDEQRKSMADIFRELHVTGADNSVASFFRRAQVLLGDNKKDHFKPSDLSVLIATRRIEAVVKRWKELQSELEKIFEQRERFIETTNSLLQRKRLQLNDADELVFVSRSNKNLAAEMLSSGEKQLLILLSEALLQRQTPSIFIADEPELSLHVTWQERLVPSLRELNNQSQIIAATHSPDIVGSLSAKTIDMETLIP